MLTIESRSTTENDQEIDLNTASHSSGPMDRILKATIMAPEIGALVRGTVIGKNRLAVYVDVPPFGTGLIFGREYLNARELIKEVKTGDHITAKVVLPEGENGYIELSLKEAKQALLWSDAKKAVENKMSYDLVVKEANKGGLILEWEGIEGFLPASQLKTEHYPKVPDGDKVKIMDGLKQLVGEKLSVYVIGADPKENKLIFSEKSGDGKSRKEIVEQYALGDTVTGEVTGIVDFGVFVKLEEGFEGLVHISEINWSLVENPRDHFKVGEKIKAKVIEIKDGKISLSVKALKTNPWIEAESKYKKGDGVKGIVIKYNKHGALVSIEEGVAGLVHISEFKGEDDLRRALELGKTYPFKINLFDAKNQKLTMSLVKSLAK
ncbi:MAG TPA: S1 RNA-binding domain-containing protein [Candidatus Paceibacterota bacterium]